MHGKLTELVSGNVKYNKVIISLLLPTLDIQNDKGLCHKMGGIIFEYKNIIKEKQKLYADFCQSDYHLEEDVSKFLIFANDLRKKYPYVTEFDLIQYYKILLMGQFCEEYDEVLFLDFDVIPGPNIFNFFNQFDVKKHIAIRKDIGSTDADQDALLNASSIFRKGYIARELLNKPNNELLSHNTGVIGISKHLYLKLNFLEELKYILPIINKNKFEIIQKITGDRIEIYSNEIIFTYSQQKNNVPTIDIGYEWNSGTYDHFMFHGLHKPTLKKYFDETAN